jgi:hypothetical protein
MYSAHDLAKSLHICPDRSFASALETLGLRNIVTIEDDLMIGPCGVKCGSHFRRRTNFWKKFPEGFFGASHATQLRWAVKKPNTRAGLQQLLGPGSRKAPIVLWTTPTLRDRVPYWRLLSVMSEFGTEHRRCRLIEPTVRHKRRFVSLGCLDLDEIGVAMATIGLLTESEIALGTMLWQAFALGRPAAFLRCLEEAPSARAGGRDLAESYLAFFPALAPHGRLKLSKVDQVIFNLLSAHSWKSAIDLISKYTRSIDSGGLEFVPFRLLSWARTTRDDPVLLCRVESQQDGDLRGMLFKLTARGAEFRSRGLPLHDQFPAVHLAGIRPSKSKRWVRTRKRGRWILQQI